MSLAQEYAKQCWQLGNVIAGFAVVQALASIFYLASNELFECNVARAPTGVITASTIFFAVLYVASITYCYRSERRMLHLSSSEGSDEQLQLARWMLSGRIVAVLLFGAVWIATAQTEITSKKVHDECYGSSVSTPLK